VPGVHAVHAHVVTAAQVDHGLAGLQARATLARHQHHGVGGHHHGDRRRPVLGDRPRLRAKRTPHRVRVHSRRLAVGRSDHVSRGLFPGEAIIVVRSYCLLLEEETSSRLDDEWRLARAAKGERRTNKTERVY